MDAKDDIKRRLSVEEVVGGYVELKRAGRNFKALSPFNNEKTPSFMVSPDKQIWHDFSANRGGDIFTFVMEMEGVGFREAMEILARKAGIDLSQYGTGSGQTAKLKKRLFEALKLAARYYHVTLSKNRAALEYVKTQRGFTPETIRAFELGYAPNEGQALLRFLKSKGFSSDELKKAGLTNRSGSGDMFRGRIMVPLADGQGRVVGFTARLLADNPDAPKYINTPQTLLYDKSRHVYGLHLSKTAIRESEQAVLVEGNLDVIASHQAGVTNCVATAGTALTRDHLTQLSRLADNVLLAFDQDRAGVEATIRAIPIARQVGVNLSIVTLKDGKDPDELIKKDPKLWRDALKSTAYVMDWLVSHYRQKFDITTAQGKRDFSDALAAVLADLPDPVEVEHYAEVTAKLIGVGKNSIMSKVEQFKTGKQSRRSLRQAKTPAGDSGGYTYTFIDTFFGLTARYPDTRDALAKIDPKQLHTDWQRQLFNELTKTPNIAVKSLKTDENYVKIITFQAEELYGSRSSSERLADAFALARRIAKENLEKRKKQLTQAIRQAEEAGDYGLRDKLLRQYTQQQ